MPSSRSSDSIVMACAGQTAEHNLQAIHRSSPLSYLINANLPLKRGDRGVLTSGYWTVTFLEKNAFRVTKDPLMKSVRVSFFISLRRFM